MDRDTKDILETVNFIKDHMIANMATKDELQEVRQELKGEIQDLRTELKGEIQGLREETRLGFKEIRDELSDIKRRLEILEEQTRNHAGFAKEVDHLLSRVHAIEKHIGITK